jgi:hypothetical protein
MSNLKEPWGDGTPWKNSVAFFTYLRGCLRKAWSNNPIKHNLIKKVRKQIDNPSPSGKKKTVFGFTCELCHTDFVLAQGQVDHKIAAGSLRKTEDIQGFVERLLYVTEDDLRLICKSCNSSLAYAEKQKISFEEAVAHKTAIAICKAKKDVGWLKERGIRPDKNGLKRRVQIVNILLEEQKNE